MGLASLKLIGVMSGTSLDGLDLAKVSFANEDYYQFEIENAITIDYTEEWRDRLRNARFLSGEELMKLDVELGKFIAEQININFILDDVAAISTHGHTVFHQPGNGFTTQIGNLNTIAAITKTKVIGDFRSLDVAKGGQGAPLVPIGDKLLFGMYDFCLNLGGISNVSYEYHNKRIAFDVTPCNIVSNHLANLLGENFDINGELGEMGSFNNELFEALKQWGYYHDSKKTSLGIEDIESSFLPMLEKTGLPVTDQLHTFYHHVGNVLSRVLTDGRCLVTGGGARNKFLLKCIEEHCSSELVVPSEELIDFKEAVIFAFLGYLRLLNEVNVLASVTGASSNSCSGVIIS